MQLQIAQSFGGEYRCHALDQVGQQHIAGERIEGDQRGNQEGQVGGDPAPGNTVRLVDIIMIRRIILDLKLAAACRRRWSRA